MRRSIFCPRCGWIERGRKKVYLLHRLRCENRCFRRSTPVIFALLLVVLGAGFLSSNAIGLFGKTMDKPVDIALRQASITPAVANPDPGIKVIDALLKKFEVDGARCKRVAEAIVRSSRRHNLDPRLVASILILESRGNPFAISPSDAVGIMQIHVPTWARIVEKEGINLFKIEDNVDFGVRILRDYVKRYGRDEGIKRYNGWNPGNPESAQNAEAYLQKVQHIYVSR